MRTLVAIAALVAFLSCSDTIVQEAETPAVLTTDVVARPLGRMNVESASLYQGDSREARSARLELLDRVMDRVGRIQAAMPSEARSNDAYEAVWTELTFGSMSAAERWFVEQMAATLVLESMVGPSGSRQPTLPDGWDESAGARATELLLEHENPNAPLLAAALARLKGRWSDERIAHSAAQAADHARRWLEQDCAECGRKLEGTPTTPPEPGIEAHRILLGVNTLARLSGGE